MKRVLRALTATAIGLALVSCTNNRAPQPVEPGSQPISGPGDYSRPHRDGAPWWDVDVSRIPDAVPMPHLNSWQIMPVPPPTSVTLPMRSSVPTPLRAPADEEPPSLLAQLMPQGLLPAAPAGGCA